MEPYRSAAPESARRPGKNRTSALTAAATIASARAGAARILQPDVARVGGPSEWMRIAHIAAEHGLSIVPHFLAEIHLQLVAAIPHGLFVEYLPQLDAILVDPPRLENGEYHLPETPGHGLQFNWEKLEACRIR